jgi:anti-anti-sigma factor
MEVALSAAPFCDSVPLVHVKGDIDHGNLFDLTIAVGSALREDSPIVLFDLTDVTYIDSGGLSVLYSILRRYDDGGWLGVVRPNPTILRMLEMIGLTEQTNFRVFASLAEAEEAFLTCPDLEATG